MGRRLPPLNPLRTFEVAAHCESFTEAATELGVTQAAVSRQISVLEGFLHCQLFERSARSIKLTRVGRQLYKDVYLAFADIENATERILGERTRVRVRTYPTLAAKWLMPILADFTIAYPQIDVRIETGVRPGDFLDNDGDIFIRFGTGDWPQMKSHPLFRDELTPVCSPSLIETAGLGGREAAASLTRLNAKYRSRDWTDWFTFAGISPGREQKLITFDSSILTYQAAIDGVGIAIGQKGLLRHDLERGLLTELCGETLVRELHYWLVWPKRITHESRIFVDWVRSRAAELHP